MTDNNGNDTLTFVNSSIGKLPDQLLIEIFIRVPVSEWTQISCVKKRWANLFRGECLWQAALNKTFPLAGQAKRRYIALHVSKHIFSLDGDINEIVGHTYLFLKEQLEPSTMPPPSGVLHGTLIVPRAQAFSIPPRRWVLADQFIACGKSRDIAHELASQIWLAVLDNLEENEQTFLLLKRLALEDNVFLPYPYSRSNKVLWKVFERLFTGFRDCFNQVDYYDVLTCAKNKFQAIPSLWLGY